MDNLALNNESIQYELHDSKVVCMSPRPAVNHTIVSENINHIFRNYLNGKTCMAFGDGVDLFLEEKRVRFIPDGMIICDRQIIKLDGVHGTPDLVVEVLSPGTAKSDKGYKKDMYEKYGVREYWIVDTMNKSVEVYLLTDSKFKLSDVYAIYPDFMVEQMIEDGQNIVSSFRVSIFDDLIIHLEEVFSSML